MIVRATHNRNNPFFQMLRATAQDENLTARALGVLAYLLSKPDDWEPTIDDICRRFSDVGRSQAYQIINEIFIPLRYARRTEERSKGRFVRWLTSIFESPFAENQELVEPDVEKPDAANQQMAPVVGLPDVAEPDVVNQHLHETDKYILQRRHISEKNKDMSGAVAPVYVGQVQVVFAYWQQTLNHQQAKLTPKRERNIRARLKEKYSVEDIKQAIDGCASSPFHMGQNDKGTVYDDIELICRSGEKLESFISRRNSNGQARISHRETHNERAARETAELIAAAFQAPGGDCGPDPEDAGPPWITPDFRRLGT